MGVVKLVVSSSNSFPGGGGFLSSIDAGFVTGRRRLPLLRCRRLLSPGREVSSDFGLVWPEELSSEDDRRSPVVTG
ncbi:unnamed protein product [Brassica rapa]|uniref:Uncharacterized protein n=1 Tax=Brassica campestris TaxID=3711 RepID=A0A3P6A6W7_BRACM|nr:unnamed protein product [Brassica rapa]VDC79968.1 unnamed protein product [Brassica rapa]